jgi:hypothetical protein
VAIIFAPSSDAETHTWLPIPDDAPVTKIILPVKSKGLFINLKFGRRVFVRNEK